ncbi:MAG: dihydroorotase [Lachnospiraceae bacterium]|nr:dihydroorotase [Lachnospiraceae bacterium]
MLRIINARVVDPVNSTDEVLCVEISNGVIRHIGKDASDVSPERIIDADGAFLFPGFCDVHVHFRDPGFTHKEDIYTGAKCAARGGFTDVVMMANTSPAIDNLDTLKYVLEKGAKTPVHVHACGTVSKGLKGTELTDMKALKEAGAIGFTDDGIPLMDADLLKKAFLNAAELDMPVSLHEEDKSYIKENGINHGRASEHYGIYGSPREAESSLIARDIEIAKECGVHMEVQHISSKEGVDLVRKAKANYPDIYAEVTPHHLALTEEAAIEYGTNAKMNPPLRTEEDRLALIEGVKDGTITIIATDHAPHAVSEKEAEITKAPSGIIGLETAFTITYDVLVRGAGMPVSEFVELFTVNPRKLYKLPSEGIRVGAPADMAIFAPDREYIYDHSLSKSSNSPFMGKTLKGQIIYTICKGEICFEA